MEKTIETKGKTIEEAIRVALAQLNMDRDSVSVEVLEKPKNGIFGIGSSPARIKVTYEAPDVIPEKPVAPVRPMAPAAREPKPRVENSAPARTDFRRAAPPERSAEAAEPVTEANLAGRGAKAKAFLEGLLGHLDINAQITIAETQDGNLSIEISGSRMGQLIGRRGDMLDAVQHLTGYVANKGEKSLVRVTVDTEGYRQKREEALVRLAEKTASKVVKYRKNIALEPMNSYARHVIHSALQETPEITTFSTGTEPNRRVVVALARPDGRPVSHYVGTERRYDNNRPPNGSRPPYRAGNRGGYSQRPAPRPSGGTEHGTK